MFQLLWFFSLCCYFVFFFFQIKKIISCEKWFNYVVTFFLLFESAKNLGRWDDAKWGKNKGDGLTKFKMTMLRAFFTLQNDTVALPKHRHQKDRSWCVHYRYRSVHYNRDRDLWD